MTIGFGRLDQPLDLVRCQVLAGPKIGIRGADAASLFDFQLLARRAAGANSPWF
jgi:hypothetical protein